MTSLNEILDFLYSIITDTDLAKLANDDVKALTSVYVKMASVKAKEIKKDLSIEEDENGDLYIKDKLTTEEIMILAYGSLYYWLHSKVMYNELMKNRINTKDYNQLSNANILLRMTELLEITRKEFKRLRNAYKIRDDFQGWS